jgi:hypothetical protein
VRSAKLPATSVRQQVSADSGTYGNYCSQLSEQLKDSAMLLFWLSKLLLFYVTNQEFYPERLSAKI